VTPGITALEYAHRRSRLANRLPKNAIAVLSAADIKYRASGIFYEYHQDSNFFYLTGMRLELLQLIDGYWTMLRRKGQVSMNRMRWLSLVRY
jgi:hypothetical protein